MSGESISRRTGLKVLGAGAVGAALIGQQRPAAAAATTFVSEPGYVFFDNYFAGATDNDKKIGRAHV